MLWQLIKLIRTNFSLSLLGLNEPIVRQPLCDFLHSFWLKLYTAVRMQPNRMKKKILPLRW